jgi:hypothetical protein
MIQRSVFHYEMEYSNWHMYTLLTGYKTQDLFSKMLAIM